MSIINLSNLKLDKKEQKQIYLDINGDFAQSFGPYKNPVEEELLPYVSSGNVACGGHTGDPSTILKTLEQLKLFNISIGAQVAYPDISGFGHRAMDLTFEELKSIVLYQIGGLQSLARSLSMDIEYVKPQGALYKKLSQDLETACNFANAVKVYDPWMILVLPHGTIAEETMAQTSMRIVQEFVVGCEYNDLGNLMGKKDIDSDNVDMKEIMTSIETFVKEGKILSHAGQVLDSKAKTIHIPTNLKNSVSLAKKTKDLIIKPLPLPVTLVAQTGWV